jgi:hypothetical protein
MNESDRRQETIAWAAGITATVALSELIEAIMDPPIGWTMLMAGWALALTNAIANRVINRTAFRGTPARFMGWAIGGNILRVILLLIAIWVIERWIQGRLYPFMVGILTGYFVFMIVEMVRIYNVGSSPQATR